LPASSSSILWVYLAGAGAFVLVLIALGVALLIYQRRYLEMHRSYAQRLLQAQEEERAWVAREVHDDAVQRLAIIQREIDQVRGEGPPFTPEQEHRVGAVKEEVSDLTEVLRGLAHRLHPALLDKGGLKAALGGLWQEVHRAYGLTVRAELPNAPLAVNSTTAVAIYRIAQEALRNAARHGTVSEAQVSLALEQDTIRLTITDRGKGFVPLRGRRREGLGLLSMTERAAIAGGTVLVSSRPGEGTVVRAAFPLTPAPVS
jgi:signal transduction histidine kinase